MNGKQLDNYNTNSHDLDANQQNVNMQSQRHLSQYREDAYARDNNLNESYQNDYAMGNKAGSELFFEIMESHLPYMKTVENEIRLQSEDKKKASLIELAPKFKDIDEKNSIRCPVYNCFKQLNNQPALNSHIARNHKELVDLEIKVNPNGEIKYPSWVIDHVLRAIKWFPNFSTKVAEEGEIQLKKIKANNSNS